MIRYDKNKKYRDLLVEFMLLIDDPYATEDQWEKFIIKVDGVVDGEQRE